jgi:hypothetical protein
VLYVDGLPLLVGEGAMDMAVGHAVEIVVSSPAGAVHYRQQLLSGGLSAIYLHTGAESEGSPLEHALDIGDSEPRAAGVLSGLARRAAADVDGE